MIVIGLGTGRSGTASLAKLLNAQADALCFHEMNPSAMRWQGTPRPAINMVEEFDAILRGGPTGRLTVDLSRTVAAEAYDRLCEMPKVRLIGDIAFYHLSYVDQMISAAQDLRFICLERDKTETVDSWMRKSELPRWRSKALGERISAAITREPYHDSRNFWMEHDGTTWAHDPVWDKLFPKFPGPTKKDAIEQYWDHYTEQVDGLAQRHDGMFKTVRTETLDDEAVQADLLTFCGIERAAQIYTGAHIHQSQAAS